MELVKKNIVSILCGVLAIAAVVAWFWPVGGMFESLQAQLNQSKSQYDQVEMLRKADRKLPSLVLENSEQDSLSRFPNERVVKVGLEATKQLTAQSNRMLETVSKLNVRQPLVPGSLPKADSRALSDFPDAYLNELGQNPGQTELGWKTGIPLQLKATMPPTPEEIDDVAYGIWEKEFKIRIFEVAGSDNYAEVSTEFQAAVMGLPDIEKRKRATENLIYLDLDSIPPSNPIQLGKPPTDEEIWFAQTGLWITQDVATAINAANKGAKNVLNAPVKHLVSLRIPLGADQYILPTTAGAPMMPGGEIVPPTPNANGVLEVFSASPTGRVCNDIYDVIHFDLVLRVDFRKIPQVLAELERNRLFTVLNASIAAIDSAQEFKEHGYVYGNDPVAELSIQCEALFLRSWTVDKEHNFAAALMPETVQQHVGAKPGPGLLGGPGGGMRPPPGSEAMEFQ